MNNVKKATEVKRLYDALFHKADKSKSLQEQLATVVAEMDKRLGKDWREVANPDGIEFVEIVEGGKPLKENKEGNFFENVRKEMLKEGMNVDNIVSGIDLPCTSKHNKNKEKKKELHEQIKVVVKVSK